MKCDSCGEPATHIRDNYDICPTDQGCEYRFYAEAMCDDCDPETKHPHPLMDVYMASLSAYGYPRGRR